MTPYREPLLDQAAQIAVTDVERAMRVLAHAPRAEDTLTALRLAGWRLIALANAVDAWSAYQLAVGDVRDAEAVLGELLT